MTIRSLKLKFLVHNTAAVTKPTAVHCTTAEHWSGS